MRTIVFLLEEPSAEEMLKGVLPRLYNNQVYFRFLVFEGKQDLEKQLVRRLRGWKTPDTNFVVLRDQDHGNCHKLKQALADKCRQANKADTLIRIACNELESFYLGDLLAVERGLELSGISTLQNKAKYRMPDNLTNPSEEMYRITREKYQKLSGSRAIGPYLLLDNTNRSHSFNILIEGLKRLNTR